MALNRNEMFKKIFSWSFIGMAVFGITFWFITDIFGLLRGQGDIVIFSYAFFTSGLLGSIVGSGLVFWRILENYYPSHIKKCMKLYRRFIIIGVVTFIGSLFVPFGPLPVLWLLFMSPICVYYSMKKENILPKR